MSWTNWEDFYSIGAKTELKKVKEIIKSGETDPLRVINIFQDFNQRHTRTQNDDGDMVYVERPKEDGHLPTGKPAYSEIDLLYKQTLLSPYTKVQESRLILDVMRLSDFDYDAIVDLGAGWGRVLFDLYYEGLPNHIEMFSAEQSPASRKITDTLSKLNSDIKIKTTPFDFRDPNVDFLKKKKKVFFYSVYSFMFIPLLQESLIDTLLEAAPKTECLHIEPLAHQLIQEGENMQSRRQKSDGQNWNQDMSQVLYSMAKAGKLELPWGALPDILPPPNPTSYPATLYYWKKRA